MIGQLHLERGGIMAALFSSTHYAEKRTSMNSKPQDILDFALCDRRSRSEVMESLKRNIDAACGGGLSEREKTEAAQGLIRLLEIYLEVNR